MDDDARQYVDAVHDFSDMFRNDDASDYLTDHEVRTNGDLKWLIMPDGGLELLRRLHQAFDSYYLERFLLDNHALHRTVVMPNANECLNAIAMLLVYAFDKDKTIPHTRVLDSLTLLYEKTGVPLTSGWIDLERRTYVLQ